MVKQAHDGSLFVKRWWWYFDSFYDILGKTKTSYTVFTHLELVRAAWSS